MNRSKAAHNRHKKAKARTEENKKIIAGCSGTTINLFVVLIIRVSDCLFLTVYNSMWWVMNVYVNIFVSTAFCNI